MNHPRGRGPVACFLSAIPTVSQAFAGDSASAVSSALAESARALRIQTDFPAGRAAGGGHSGFAPGGGSAFDAGVPSDLAYWLLWLSFAIVLAILAYFLISNIRETRRADKEGETGGAKTKPDAVAERMTASGAEADDLADAGDYAGAMHTLLLRSIAEIRKKLGIPISVSLTSREIARRVQLPPDAGAALSDLVGRVEISYFGSFRPGSGEYGRCRRDYDILISTLGRGGET